MDEYLEMDLEQLPYEMDQKEYCSFHSRSDGLIYCDDCIYRTDCDLVAYARNWEFCHRFLVG